MSKSMCVRDRDEDPLRWKICMEPRDIPRGDTDVSALVNIQEALRDQECNQIVVSSILPDGEMMTLIRADVQKALSGNKRVTYGRGAVWDGNDPKLDPSLDTPFTPALLKLLETQSRDPAKSAIHIVNHNLIRHSDKEFFQGTEGTAALTLHGAGDITFTSRHSDIELRIPLVRGSLYGVPSQFGKITKHATTGDRCSLIIFSIKE
jgi:hypothetical protein